MKGAKDRARDIGAHDLYLEGAITGGLKAVVAVMVGGEDDYLVSQVLESESGVDNELFSSTDTKVWMDKADAQLLGGRVHRMGHLG